VFPLHPRSFTTDSDSYFFICQSVWEGFLSIFGLKKSQTGASSRRKPSSTLISIASITAMTTIFTAAGIAGITPANAAEPVAQSIEIPEVVQQAPVQEPVIGELAESASLAGIHDPIFMNAPAGTALGIDVGSSQAGIDLNAFDGNGGGFVIVKQGGANTGGSPYVAPRYTEQLQAARAAGLPVGHYWFNGQEVSVEEQAQFFNDTAQVELGDIIALDIESEPSTNTRAFSPAEATTWIEGVHKKYPGVKVVLYMNVPTINAADWSGLTDNPLWVASFGENDGSIGSIPSTGPWPEWTIWQYSSTARVPGFGGAIDANIAKLDLFSRYGWDPAKVK
jgi:GH25 family lysozyme M1 (1,4-beta-N-acetylmuramidase)